MKSSKLTLLALSAFVCFHLAVHGQNPPTAEIATYAGLTVTGTTGSIYAIESTEDLSQAEGWEIVGLIKLKPGKNLWFDTQVLVAGKRFYRAVEMTTIQPAANMVFIDPGTFVMGSPSTEVDRNPNEGPQTQVTFTRGFLMGRYEVTQAEYLAVTGTNPSAFQSPTNTSRPVESVSWHDAAAYCAMLTTTERMSGKIPTNWSYRLPSEAEWEYACRAGRTTRYNYGEDPGITLLSQYAWYSANSPTITRPVGQKLPNALGLYDMHGNLFEWCQDTWDLSANYSGACEIDPLKTTGSYRVLRGGRWGDLADHARSAYRGFGFPNDAVSFFGFRIVLAPVK